MSYALGQNNKLVPDDTQEPASHYYKGGYHVLHLGEKLNRNRYLVLRKMGWDELSTKWLVKDCEKSLYLMITIYKASEMHTEYATNLIRKYNKIQEHPCDRIMKLMDHFQVIGINGTHVCTVTELMSECLNNYMIRLDFKPTSMDASKVIVKQVLEGLDHLHRKNKMVHTNIKPETIFFKASKSYIHSLLYDIFAALHQPEVPTSYVCNLPSRMNPLRTHMSIVQQETLLEDKEFATYVERRLRQSTAAYELALDRPVLHSVGAASNRDESPSEVVEETNTLIGRISNYLKSNLMELSKGKEIRPTSTSMRSSYIREHYSTPECHSTLEGLRKGTSEDRSDDVPDMVAVDEICEGHGEPCVPRASSIEEEVLNNREHPTEMELFLAEALIERWYKFMDNRFKDLSEKCRQVREEVIGNSAETEDETWSLKDDDDGVVDGKSEEIVANEKVEDLKALDETTGNIEYIDEAPKITGEDEGAAHEDGQVTIEANENPEGDSKTDDTRSDFLDDLKTSPDLSEGEGEGEYEEAEVKPKCQCGKCHQSESSKENKGSDEEEGSYSTSTSTQESYTEFFLNYCKHNTQCTEFSKFASDDKKELLVNDEEIEIVIGDLANVRNETDEGICKEDVQRQYRAVELLYKSQFDAKIDIWSVGCLTFELVTGDFMFNPNESKYYTIDEHHLLRAIQLLGEIPPDLLEQDRVIRNIKHFLERDHHNIEALNARENFYRTLRRSYRFPPDDAKQLSRFLVPMLQVNPARRASAAQCLDNEWLVSA